MSHAISPTEAVAAPPIVSPEVFQVINNRFEIGCKGRNRSFTITLDTLYRDLSQIEGDRYYQENPPKTWLEKIGHFLGCNYCLTAGAGEQIQEAFYQYRQLGWKITERWVSPLSGPGFPVVDVVSPAPQNQ